MFKISNKNTNLPSGSRCYKLIFSILPVPSMRNMHGFAWAEKVKKGKFSPSPLIFPVSQQKDAGMGPKVETFWKVGRCGLP